MLHNCCHPSNTFTLGQNVWKQRLPAINLSTFVKSHLIKQQDSALQADVEGEVGGDFFVLSLTLTAEIKTVLQ